MSERELQEGNARGEEEHESPTTNESPATKAITKETAKETKSKEDKKSKPKESPKTKNQQTEGPVLHTTANDTDDGKGENTKKSSDPRMKTDNISSAPSERGDDVSLNDDDLSSSSNSGQTVISIQLEECFKDCRGNGDECLTARTVKETPRGDENETLEFNSSDYIISTSEKQAVGDRGEEIVDKNTYSANSSVPKDDISSDACPEQCEITTDTNMNKEHEPLLTTILKESDSLDDPTFSEDAGALLSTRGADIECLNDTQFEKDCISGEFERIRIDSSPCDEKIGDDCSVGMKDLCKGGKPAAENNIFSNALIYHADNISLTSSQHICDKEIESVSNAFEQSSVARSDGSLKSKSPSIGKCDSKQSFVMKKNLKNKQLSLERSTSKRSVLSNGSSRSNRNSEISQCSSNVKKKHSISPYSIPQTIAKNRNSSKYGPRGKSNYLPIATQCTHHRKGIPQKSVEQSPSVQSGIGNKEHESPPTLVNEGVHETAITLSDEKLRETASQKNEETQNNDLPTTLNDALHDKIHKEPVCTLPLNKSETFSKVGDEPEVDDRFSDIESVAESRGSDNRSNIFSCHQSICELVEPIIDSSNVDESVSPRADDTKSKNSLTEDHLLRTSMETVIELETGSNKNQVDDYVSIGDERGNDHMDDVVSLSNCKTSSVESPDQDDVVSSSTRGVSRYADSNEPSVMSLRLIETTRDTSSPRPVVEPSLTPRPVKSAICEQNESIRSDATSKIRPKTTGDRSLQGRGKKTSPRQKKRTGAQAQQDRKEFVKEELRRLTTSLRREATKIHAPEQKEHTPYIFSSLEPYYNTHTVKHCVSLETGDIKHGFVSRNTALGLCDPQTDLDMDRNVLPRIPSTTRSARGGTVRTKPSATGSRSSDKSNKPLAEGSTRLPKFPMVKLEDENEIPTKKIPYSEVPLLREELRKKYNRTASQKRKEEDYRRTQNDFYRMDLDKMEEYHPINRPHMRRAYFAYLQNTPGSRKAIHECVRRTSKV